MNIAPQIKERFNQYYKDVHSSKVGTMLGEMILVHVWDIQDLVQKHKPKNYLDFGCGAAFAYKNRKIQHIMDCGIYLHDIGVPEYTKRPPAELIEAVVSIDVLEHIPEELIDETFDYWASCNPKFVFATVAQYPSKAVLSNGENAHCTIKSVEWWESKINKHFSKETEVVIVYSPTPQKYLTKVY